MTSRSRSSDGSEETIVSSVLKKVFKLQNQITMESIMKGALLGDESKLIEENQTLKDMVWTSRCGSCHFDRALNVEIGLEYRKILIVVFLILF